MASKKIPKSRIIQHFLSLPEEQRVRLLNKHLSPESIKSLGANEFYTPMIGLRDKPEEEARRFLKDHFGDSPEHLKKTVKHGEVLAENFKDSIYSNFGGKTDEDKLYALVKSQTMSNRLRIFYEDLSDKAKKSYNNAALASLNKKNVLSYYLDDPRNFAEGKSPDDFLEDVMKTMDLSKEKSMMEHIRTGAPAEDPDRKEKIQLAAQMCMILPESRFDPEAFTGELQDKDWKKNFNIQKTLEEAKQGGRLPMALVTHRIRTAMNDIPETEEEKALFREAALQTCRDIKGIYKDSSSLESEKGKEFLGFYEKLQTEMTAEAMKQQSVQDIQDSLAKEYSTLQKEKSGLFLSKTNSPEYNDMMKHLKLFNAKLALMNGQQPKEPLTDEELNTVQNTDADVLLSNAKQGCYNYGSLKTKNGRSSIWHNAGTERFDSSMKTLSQLGELGKKLHLGDSATAVRDDTQLQVLQNRSNKDWLSGNIEDAVAKTICAQVLLNRKTPDYQQRSMLEGDALTAQVEKIKSHSAFQKMMKTVSHEKLADAIIRGSDSLYEVYHEAVRTAKAEGHQRTASEIDPESIKQKKGTEGLVPGLR